MGEAKQEETKAEAKPEENKEEKKEEKAEEKKDEKPEEIKEEKKEEETKPSPPPPIVLYVDLHCVGCARKVERSIFKCKGVESAVLDMVQNQVTVTGSVDPEALCSRIQKKTLRRAKILSPLPPAERDSKPAELVPAQVSGINVIELLVNMHCEACAQQLRRKILKMRGVQTAETNFAAGQVKVTGTMKGEKLVEYIHRRTGKLATIVPPPPPPPPPPPQEEEKKDQEPEKKQEEKPAEENKEEEKKEESAEKKKEESAEKKKEEEKKPEQEEEKAEGNKEDKGSGGEEEPKKESADGIVNHYNVSYYNPSEVEMMKRMIYWNGGFSNNMHEDDMGRRNMQVPWMPFYVVQPPPPPPPPQLLYRTPPPQLFSDENPNACCIS